MPLILFTHPDGGHYVKVDDHRFQMKMDDGRWEPGVLFRRVERGPGPSHHWQYVGGNTFGVTKKHWDDRFTETGETTARSL